MKEISSMLFDLDGTLIDSKTDLTNSTNRMLANLGRTTLSEAAVASFVGDGARLLAYRSLAATHPAHQPPDDALLLEAIALMETYYAEELLKTTRLYPKVAETLAALTDKRKAVVTSKAVHLTRILLEHFDIAHHFETIVGGDTTPARKPDPGPVLEAIKQIGGAASETMMIGDSQTDVIAGKRAGTATCAVLYGFRSVEELQATEPDVLIERFDQLAEVFS